MLFSIINTGYIDIWLSLDVYIFKVSYPNANWANLVNESRPPSFSEYMDKIELYSLISLALAGVLQ